MARHKPKQESGRDKPRQSKLRVEPPVDRRRRWLVWAMLCIVSVVALWPVLRAPFLNFDDQDAVAQNPDFVNPATGDLSHYWIRPYQNLYTPLTYTIWGVIADFSHEAKSVSLTPAPFHAANLLVHLASATWVYAILLLLLRDVPQHIWAAGAGAMLFAIHPIQVEAVAWVTSFNTVLSGMLALWAIWHYLRFTELSRDELRARAARPWIHYSAGLAVFILAMLAKPSAVVTPLVAGTLAVGLLQTNWRRTALLLLPWMLAAAPIIVVAKLTQPGFAQHATPLLLRPLVAGDALTFYLWKLLAPLELMRDYGRTPQYVIHHGLAYWTWLAPAALLALAWVFRRRWPVLLAGASVFTLALLPVLGLTWFDYQMFSTVADRYLYLSMLGPALIAAVLLGQLLEIPSARRAVLAGAAVILLPLGADSFHQAGYWNADEALAAHELAADSANFDAHIVLGFLSAARNDVPEATAHYQAALQTCPGDARTEYNWGNVLLRQKQFITAIAHYRIALLRDPQNVLLNNNLGIALAQANQPQEALERFEEAARLNPHFANAQCNIARMLEFKGDFDGAINHFQHALEFDPNLPEAQRGLAEARAARQHRPPATP